jgi:hypothetical protein
MVIIMTETKKAKPDFDLVYDGINGLIKLIKIPGEWFKITEYGIVPGIIFVGIIGTFLVLGAMYLGLH